MKFYNEKLNFTENIYNLFLNTNSYLYDLGLNVLKHEINDIGTYCSILEAISNDKNRIGDIASSLNVKSTYLTRYLQKLIDMMIIKKEVPIKPVIIPPPQPVYLAQVKKQAKTRENQKTVLRI